MTNAKTPTQITELHGLAPQARQQIQTALDELLGEVELDYDFYREWSGGWRVRVTVSGRGMLDFVLFHTPTGALLALPIPMPERWRTSTGLAASDNSRWTLSDEGEVTPFV